MKKTYTSSVFLILFALCSVNGYAITDALKIKIARAGYSDETVIRFASGATDGFDGSFDAWKLFSSNASVPNIFSKDNAGDELTINARPELISSTYEDVYLKIGTAATYSISTEETGAFASGVCIMMKDLITGQLYDMRTTTTYLIPLPVIAQADPARFRVFFSYPASVQTTHTSCTNCPDGSAVITKAGEINWLYSVSNSSGVNVASGTSVIEAHLINGLAAGTYTAMISSDYTCLETIPFSVAGPVTYYSRASGNWSDVTTWSASGCGSAAASSVPGSDNNVVICSGNSVIMDVASSCMDITINSGTLSAAGSFTVTGNWVNNGTFSAGTETVTFGGIRMQSISGSSASVFNNLTINNSTPAEALRLNVPVTVNGILRLKDGHITTTSAYSLTCGASASISLLCTPQDSSFVKGPMSHTVNVSSGVIKVFPVGKNNSYRRIDLTVDQKFSTPTIYTAEMIDNSAEALGYTLPVSLSNVSFVRYHEITQTPNTKLDMAQVRMYFGCAGIDDQVQTLPPISVAKDDGSGSWVDLDDSPNGYSCGSTYWGNDLSGTFTAFAGTKFALGNTGDPAVLGVNLVDFTVKASGQKAELSWSTASETNSDYFTLERSMDGKQFEEAGRTNAAGYSSETRNYKMYDDNPFADTSYYRLKETDKNGLETFSKIMSVYFNNDNIFSVYPNPFSEIINIHILGLEGKESTLAVYDALGKECYSQKIILASGNVTASIFNKNQFLPGVYSITLLNEERCLTQKVIIK